MSFARTHHLQGGAFYDDYKTSFSQKNCNDINDNNIRNYNHAHHFSQKCGEYNYNIDYKPHYEPSLKRRKVSSSSWEVNRRCFQQPNIYDNAPSTCSTSFLGPLRQKANTSLLNTTLKRDRSKLDTVDDVVFMSRDDIERCSPSRKDGIDALWETHLRYSYCAFLRELGMRLELPQTTIGTAMVLCHRFFLRRSHACHDRFLISTAALFLAAKNEETPRPLNNVLRTSTEICHRQNLTFLSYLLPIDWFEQYRERVLEAEQMILTTLNFELEVQHPYVPLTSIFNKLGLSQSLLVNLALNLVSEGIYPGLECTCMIFLAWRNDLLFMESLYCDVLWMHIA